jgi:threonine dehydrogenase-like Zn-dependent dehydrogenase
VVADPNESCGTCHWCRSGQPCFCNDLAAYGVIKDGGFANLTKVSEKGAYSIPEDLDFETASFTEPVSCAVHCIDRAAIKPGDSVLIIGGGPMGQIILQLAKNSGAGDLVMVTRSEWKLRLSETFGTTHSINAGSEDVIDRTMQITGGIGADVVIEAAGSPGTMELALRLAKKSGRVVIFGFVPQGEQARFYPFDILSRELTVMGSWVNPFTFNRAITILQKGEIDVRSLISHKFTLENILESLKMMKEKPDGFVKALINIDS